MFWAVVFGILTIIVAVIGFSIGIDMLAQRKRILSTPHHSANDIIDGLSAFEGKAVSLEKYLAPFSQQDVVYCEAKAEQLRVVDGKVKQNSFDTIYDTISEKPFLIQNDSGYILVKPENGHADIDRSFDTENYKYKIGQFHVRLPTDHMQVALEDAGASYKDGQGPLPIYFSELSIANGEKIFAIGMRSSNMAEIKDLLNDNPINSKTRILGVLQHGEGKNEGLYFTTGNKNKAVRSLFRFGWSLMIATPIVTLILILLSWVSYYDRALS